MTMHAGFVMDDEKLNGGTGEGWGRLHSKYQGLVLCVFV
jgi:hypothetical protein